MSILVELRQAIALSSFPERRRQLEDAANNLHDAIEDFYRARDTGSLRKLNGAWARAMHIKHSGPNGLTAEPSLR